MFWNLVRYEFKNVNKWYLSLYGVILVISVLIGYQSGALAQLKNVDDTLIFFFLSLVFGGLMITLFISTLILIIRRFKGSVYDRQGYLTLTLPVSEHHIILSKLFGAFVWTLLSYIVFVASISIIIFLSPLEKDYIYIYRFFSIHLFENWIYIPYLVFNAVFGILLIYLSISIGQLFNEYRTALAVLAYIVINIILSFFGIFFRIDSLFDLNLYGNNFNWFLYLQTVKNLILSIIAYVGTYYILKNKVNLQ